MSLNRNPAKGRRIHEGMDGGAVGPGTPQGQAKRTPANEPVNMTVTHADSQALMRTTDQQQLPDNRHNP